MQAIPLGSTAISKMFCLDSVINVLFGNQNFKSQGLRNQQNESNPHDFPVHVFYVFIANVGEPGRPIQ